MFVTATVLIEVEPFMSKFAVAKFAAVRKPVMVADETVREEKIDTDP